MKAIFFCIGTFTLLLYTCLCWWPELTEPPSHIQKIKSHETRLNNLEQKYSHIKLAVLEEL